MEANLKQLSAYLDAISGGLTTNVVKPTTNDPVLKNIFEKVNLIHTYLNELYQASIALADGNLQFDIHGDNLYVGTLKDLQASLKHLLWQVGRIADGDYDVSVDFLGDFSEQFHTLIKQLKERETTLKENDCLNEILAKQQIQLLENELERSIEKYDQFAKSMADIRSYRHDMQNHLLCIDSLLQEKDFDGAQRYIHSLASIFTIMNQTAKSENYILDALLNDKIERAKALYINVEKKVKISRKLKIDNKDWCILIGNALDNSIEALTDLDENERKLIIKMSQIEDMLSVSISNTIARDMKLDIEHLETTKMDRANHGIGLKNIKETVVKYNGEMSIEVERQKFTLTFLLCGV